MVQTFEEFTARSVEEGFDEVLVREWQPNLSIDTHTHPFDVSAFVQRGELVLTVGDKAITLKAGDRHNTAIWVAIAVLAAVVVVFTEA